MGGVSVPVIVALVMLAGARLPGPGDDLGNGKNPSLCLNASFAGADPLFVIRSGDGTLVQWNSDGGGEQYDLVRGDLNVLTGDCDHDGVTGDCIADDFRNALNAISPSSDVCMADNTSSGQVLDSRAAPAAGRESSTSCVKSLDAEKTTAMATAQAFGIETSASARRLERARAFPDVGFRVPEPIVAYT